MTKKYPKNKQNPPHHLCLYIFLYVCHGCIFANCIQLGVCSLLSLPWLSTLSQSPGWNMEARPWNKKEDLGGGKVGLRTWVAQRRCHQLDLRACRIHSPSWRKCCEPLAQTLTSTGAFNQRLWLFKDAWRRLQNSQLVGIWEFMTRCRLSIQTHAVVVDETLHPFEPLCRKRQPDMVTRWAALLVTRTTSHTAMSIRN